jgi:intraflagellar transport protein 122
LYQAPGDVAHDLRYKSIGKIVKNIECSSMIITLSHLVVSQDKRLHCYNLMGEEIRVWSVLHRKKDTFEHQHHFRNMDSPIRYLKLVGGPVEHEAVLIGLKNGGVYQVFVNNPFPQLLAKRSGTIHCVDMNANRTKVAIIDETSTLFVYDARTKELLYQVM